MYADDTTIYLFLEDFEITYRELATKAELDKVNVWLKLNKLTVNVEKTKCVWYHKRRKPNPIKLVLNGKQIDIVTYFSFLGVIIDEHISWKNHAEMVANKLSKLVGILHKLKYVYPKFILETIYKSLFVPHLNFGSLVWGSKINQIEKIQKKAIRVITHSKYIAHTEPLLKELRLLKAQDMFSLKLILFLNKLSHNTLPPYFETYRPYLEKITTSYNLRAHALPAPHICHAYAEFCLIFQLVKMKNNLSKNNVLILSKIEEKSHSLSGLKEYVKNTFLDKYSYSCVIEQCHTCGRD